MKLHVPLVDGRIIVFEGSYEELVDVAEKFISEHGSEIAGKPVPPHVPAKSGNGSRRWNEQTVRRLWGLMYGEQAKLVKFMTARGTAEYAELSKHMGYDAQRLSGVLSAITRNSQTATGDRSARLVDWRISKNGKREYFVDADALPLLRQVIQQP